MKVRINDKCIGCGTCSQIAPEVFNIKDGHAVVLDSVNFKNQDIQTKAKEAASLCPVQAIEIIEDEV